MNVGDDIGDIGEHVIGECNLGQWAIGQSVIFQ